MLVQLLTTTAEKVFLKIYDFYVIIMETNNGAFKYDMMGKRVMIRTMAVK